MGHSLYSFINYHFILLSNIHPRNYIHYISFILYSFVQKKMKYLIFPLTIEKRIGKISLRVRRVVLFFGVEKLGSNNIGKLIIIIIYYYISNKGCPKINARFEFALSCVQV